MIFSHRPKDIITPINVLCLSTTGWVSEKARQDVIDILADLHKEPSGQQILTLFKVGPLVPFHTDQLETVRQLRMQYFQLLCDRKPVTDIGSNSGAPTAFSP